MIVLSWYKTNSAVTIDIVEGNFNSGTEENFA